MTAHDSERTESTPARAHECTCERQPIEIRIRDDQLLELARIMVMLLDKAREAYRDPGPPVGVQEVAAWTGLSVPTVYRRALDLGGYRVGNGPRAAWRFNLGEVAERYDPGGYGWLR